MCREKGAVKHDDRLDTLAQGVKYFTDALSISAHDAIKTQKKRRMEQYTGGFSYISHQIR